MAQNDRTTGLVGNAAFKVPVKAATTANITLSGEQTIDGVSCVDGDRVLVKDQTIAQDNGIYVVDTGTWDRAKDFDGPHDVVRGSLVMVNPGGAANANTYWRVTSADPVTIDADDIDFAQALTSDSALLGFTQSGASSVATTVQDVLRALAATPYQKGGNDYDSDPAADATAALFAAIQEHAYVDLCGKRWRVTDGKIITNTGFKGMRNGTILVDITGLAANKYALDFLTNTIPAVFDGVKVVGLSPGTVGTNSSRTGNLTFSYREFNGGLSLYQGSILTETCSFENLHDACYVSGAIADVDIKTVVRAKFKENIITFTGYLLGHIEFAGHVYLGSEVTFPSCANVDVSGYFFIPGTPAVDVGGSAAVNTAQVNLHDIISYGRDPIVCELGARSVRVSNVIAYVTQDSPSGVGVGITTNAGGQIIESIDVDGVMVRHYGDEDGGTGYSDGVAIYASNAASCDKINVNNVSAWGPATVVRVEGFDATRRMTDVNIDHIIGRNCTDGITVSFGTNVRLGSNIDLSGSRYGVSMGNCNDVSLGPKIKTRGFTNHYRFAGASGGSAFILDDPDHDAANEAALFFFDAATGNMLGKNIRAPWAGIEPTAGNWTNGSTFLATGSSLGAIIGKICTTSGTAGTWSVYGGQAGYRSGAGSPIGAVTPTHIGEEYLNTTGPAWFKSTGLTNADWVALN